MKVPLKIRTTFSMTLHICKERPLRARFGTTFPFGALFALLLRPREPVLVFAQIVLDQNRFFGYFNALDFVLAF